MTPSDGIVVERVRKVFHQAGTGEAVVAIDRLDFRISRGEMVAIVGQTGCGKSTLLNLLIGLDRPSEGRVAIDGRTPYDDFHHFRGHLAAVFQQDRLLPWRTALDNVRLGLELLGYGPAEQIERARRWLDRLGLGPFVGAFPHELSGGMRQRVALARAFAIQPELLLADEAFGHLDEVTAASLRQTFVELARREGNTAVLVTHQLEEAIELGDRILVFGKPARLLADIHLERWRPAELLRLRTVIQRMIHANEPAPELAPPEEASR
ncbi:MAG: ABC transporter [Candidatus Rokubacteria bacterium 13_1_40CM_69_27]|nr:MAG: ABC transporter [Candidatus Rokubacteria bacterium 13_1_40CM_69_27]OLC37657.1 MAG: ABC transporter [Candidatus Rokubacteria bacterium 13_1_40CM_4_69_5]